MRAAIKTKVNENLRFFSVADMEDLGVKLEPGALHRVAREAWADIRGGRAYGLKSVLLPDESELWGADRVDPISEGVCRRAAWMEIVSAFQRWAGLRCRQDCWRQCTQSTLRAPKINVDDPAL